MADGETGVAPARGREAPADARNRQPRGTLRRQQILDAAIELFARKGFRGTGVAALGERVGMTATGLLYYFGSKERLLAEVIAERDRRDSYVYDDTLTLSDLRDLGRPEPDKELFSRLTVVLNAENIDPGEPLHEYFVSRYGWARLLIREALERMRDRGELRDDVEVNQIATEVMATLLGLELQWVTDPDAVDYESTVERYIDRLVEDLAPRS